MTEGFDLRLTVDKERSVSKHPVVLTNCRLSKFDHHLATSDNQEKKVEKRGTKREAALRGGDGREI